MMTEKNFLSLILNQKDKPQSFKFSERRHLVKSEHLKNMTNTLGLSKKLITLKKQMRLIFEKILINF